MLGIDPGVSRCGYGCVEAEGTAFRVLGAGVIATDRDEPLERRLAELAGELAAVVEETAPGAVAVERVLFQVNARTAMSVGQAAGLALLVAAQAGLAVTSYSANEVKQAVTGWGGADKRQVQRMVAALLALEAPPRPADVADALALALCHLAALRHRSAGVIPPAPCLGVPREGSSPSRARPGRVVHWRREPGQ